VLRHRCAPPPRRRWCAPPLHPWRTRGERGGASGGAWGAWVRAGEGSAVVGVGDEGMRREEEKEVGGLL
jgi:hypothetical protein